MIELAQDAPKGATELTVRTHERLAQFLMVNTPNTYLTTGNTTWQVLVANPVPSLPNHYRILLATTLSISLTKLTQFTVTINDVEVAINSESVASTLTITDLIEDDLIDTQSIISTLTLSQDIDDVLESPPAPDLTSNRLSFFEFDGNRLERWFGLYSVTRTGPFLNYVTGAQGLALDFTGVQSAFASPAMGDTSGNYTIGAWIKTTDTNDWLRVQINSLIISISPVGIASTDSGNTISFTSIATGTWKYFVFTKSGEHVANVYVDGVQVVTDASFVHSNNPIQFFRIGANTVNWIGNVDNLIFYNRVLTLTEIQYLYSINGNPVTG